MSTKKTNTSAGPNTLLAHAGYDPRSFHGFVNPPVVHASTVLFPDAKTMATRNQKYTYGTHGTPTTDALAQAFDELEGSAGTVVVPSGLAAVTLPFLACLSAGDPALVVDSVYGPPRRFCDTMLKRLGVEVTYYDPTIGAGIAELIRPNTTLVHTEAPGSNTFEMQDIPAIAKAAKAAGAVVTIDNTWATPLYFPAMAHGVDIAILACTKYIVGHSDVMMGSVTANADWFGKIRQTAYLFGQMVSPDDAWLAARGLRTLGVRLAQHRDGALAVARWLKDQPGVARVLHPALPDCPGHAHWSRDFSGSTGLFTFILDGGDDAARAALIDGLAHFGIGYSWGGFESLALPVDPARYRSATRWQAAGPAVRLHIGLEDPADLIADLDAGLARFRAAC